MHNTHNHMHVSCYHMSYLAAMTPYPQTIRDTRDPKFVPLIGMVNFEATFGKSRYNLVLHITQY